MKQLPDYSLIDQKATGARLKSVIRASGYRVSEIQQFLSLSCPQPIYRWFRGETLPSLHHMYALSGLLDVPLDDLLVQGQLCAANGDPQTPFSGNADTPRKTENCPPLRIDFEKTQDSQVASAMYGIALFAKLCISDHDHHVFRSPRP